MMLKLTIKLSSFNYPIRDIMKYLAVHCHHRVILITVSAEKSDIKKQTCVASRQTDRELNRQIYTERQTGRPVADTDMGAVPKVPLLAGQVSHHQHDGEQQEAEHLAACMNNNSLNILAGRVREISQEILGSFTSFKKTPKWF